MEPKLKYELGYAYAREQDNQDELKGLGAKEFCIPSEKDLKKKRLGDSPDTPDDEITSLTEKRVNPRTLFNNDLAVYLCGNSLGLQPKRVKSYIASYLETWQSLGVFGHFKELEGSLTVPWVRIDEQTSKAISKIVGAHQAEVTVMQTLTANLHLLMASFYRPTKDRYKIILEGKAFPSDHYAVSSQLEHHNLKKEDAMVLINPSDADKHYFSTQHILDTIEKHAESTAVLLLPGVHYYSGQFLDIPTITKFAQSKGITVGWDLAHAVGNVPLKLHDWNVDFAAWCSYKYLNAGPGSIAGLFVHERHGTVTKNGNNLTYTPRLSGWWGNDKEARFDMEDRFVPTPGAAGWQLSNPSMLDCTSLLASLSVFNETSMEKIREKSVKLTGYLEYLLREFPLPEALQGSYTILTPINPAERGAQISIRLKPGLLEKVMAALEEQGVVVDDRKPDVIRVAPAPLYNSFADVWLFMTYFVRALSNATGTELPDVEFDKA